MAGEGVKEGLVGHTDGNRWDSGYNVHQPMGGGDKNNKWHFCPEQMGG